MFVRAQMRGWKQEDRKGRRWSWTQVFQGWERVAPFLQKNLLDFGPSKNKQQGPAPGGSHCREDDGAGLDACHGMLVCL